MSAAACRIELFCGEILLGQGTAFFDEAINGRRYLFTNWHCVTGRSPTTGRPQSKDGITPDSIVIYLHRFLGRDGIDFLHPIPHRLPIEYRSGTKWLMHPSGQKIDIVAHELDLSMVEPTPLGAYISRLQSSHNAIVQVGAEVFILGFPRGLTPTGSLPIWKKGSIASEPAHFADGEPCFWVDSATREGMSGSPVFVRRLNNNSFDNVTIESEARLVASEHLNFCGIYSGRIGVSDLLEAQIGKVWNPACMSQIVNSGVALDYEEFKA